MERRKLMWINVGSIVYLNYRRESEKLVLLLRDVGGVNRTCLDLTTDDESKRIVHRGRYLDATVVT